MNESRTARPSVSPIGHDLETREHRSSGPNKTHAEVKFRKVPSKNEKIRRLDEAICELEEIYASLNLDDEDLLDRAERRDMPSKFQLMRLNSMVSDCNRDFIREERSYGGIKTQMKQSDLSTKDSILPEETGWAHPHCDEFSLSRNRHRNLGFVDSLLSSSDPPYRYKTPARRRSAIPDPVADDLAVRKLVKNRDKTLNEPTCKKIQSYLLVSPIFSPSNKNNLHSDTISVENLLSTEPKPDIEKDDLSYRKFIQSEAATVSPAHPPFGIPIGPTGLTTTNNYAQATLSERDKKFFYYRVRPYYPHLIKDDMAFRSFRKDLDKPWINGINLLPVTTNHLMNQRNEIDNTIPSSVDPVQCDQVRYQQPYHSLQYATRGFISSSSDNLLSSLV